VKHLQLLLDVVQPVWARTAARVRRVRTAGDARAHEMQMATAAGWQEELRQLVTETLLCSTVMKRLVLQPDDAAGVGDAVLQLLHRRALSLQQHAEPPRSLAACLAEGEDGKAAAAAAAEEPEPQPTVVPLRLLSSNSGRIVVRISESPQCFSGTEGRGIIAGSGWAALGSQSNRACQGGQPFKPRRAWTN
jgi:hypothetical protein